MGGGPSAKWKHEGCVAAPRQTAGTESLATLDACFMQTPASESLFFPFPSQKGQINRPDLEKRLRVHACNQVGVVGGHCSEYGENIWLKDAEIKINFNLAFKGLSCL